MKPYKSIFYILFLSIIWMSCDKDEASPTIDLSTPEAFEPFTANQTMLVEGTFSDDKELDYAEITLTGPESSGLKERRITLTGNQQHFSQEFTLDFNKSGIMTLRITVVDKDGKSTGMAQDHQFSFFEAGDLNVNMKLQYDGVPLVMFEPYEYPDGKAINFTRFSLYTSDFQIDNEVINEVEFHNLTNSHSTAELAENGYDWSLSDIPVGSYDRISFNIGVPEALNGMDPGEFPSGHPLAKPAENWFSWKSYIFLKVEGNIDLDGDGVLETGIALHTGSDEALRNVGMEYPLIISQDQTSQINLAIDLYQLFNGSERIYPIEENPQIHSLTQLDAALEISDNIKNSIHKN